MYPPIHFEVVKFAAALSVCVAGMAWWHKGSKQDDEIVSEACDVIIESVADADKVNKVELHTGRNLRDQVSLEQAIEIDRERTLRRFARRN